MSALLCVSLAWCHLKRRRDRNLGVHWSKVKVVSVRKTVFETASNYEAHPVDHVLTTLATLCGIRCISACMGAESFIFLSQVRPISQ